MENPFDALNKSIHEKSQQMTKKEYLTAICFNGVMDKKEEFTTIKDAVESALFAAKQIIKQCADDR